jgi:hypothetical protein
MLCQVEDPPLDVIKRIGSSREPTQRFQVFDIREGSPVDDGALFEVLSSSWIMFLAISTVRTSTPDRNSQKLTLELKKVLREPGSDRTFGVGWEPQEAARDTTAIHRKGPLQAYRRIQASPVG